MSPDQTGSRVRLRSRRAADDPFILQITESELVPILERSWQFSWDRGHARKFLLDLQTMGETHMVLGPGQEALGYVWFLIRHRGRGLLRRRIFWLNYLVLDGRVQGRGLGREVLEHCRREAVDRGCAAMELWVQAGNPGARRFYARHGFRPVGRVRGNVHMRRRLP